MTPVAPAVAVHPAPAPPAQGPPGRGSRDFAPVLRSEGEKPDPETSETSARTARAEGTTPRADDPGASKADSADRRPESGSHHCSDCSDGDPRDGESDGVGRELSSAAHRAHEEGTPIPERVFAALGAAGGGPDPVPAGGAQVDPAPVDQAPAGDPGEVTSAIPSPTAPTVDPSALVLSEDDPAAVAQTGAPAAIAQTGTPAETPTAAVGAVSTDQAARPQEPLLESLEPAVATSSPETQSGPAGEPERASSPAPDPGAPPGTTAGAASPGTETASGTAQDLGKDAGSGNGDPGSTPRRPGHVHEHAEGGAMRLEDRPAVDSNRGHREEAGPRPAAPPPPGPQPAAPPVDTTAAQPALGAPVTVAPAAAPQLAADRTTLTRPETPVRAGSRLAELVDTFRTVVRVAAQEGRTEARITLHPGDLGEVRIRLRYEHGGVSADVLAESRQAAQTLQQSVADLRRSLESQGINVLWLDVRHGGHERPAWLTAQGGTATSTSPSSDLEDEPTGLEIPVERLGDSSSILDVLA